MSQHLLEAFFSRQKDHVEALYMALDCWEQVIYKALQSYNLDYKYVFAKNIYPFYIEFKSNWSLLLPEKDLEQSIYEVKLIDFRRQGPCDTIENLINQNKSVVIHTAFDMIPSYDKKEITVLGRTHYSTIVGYDDLNFYVMDNPFMFDKSKSSIHPDFNNISIIKKTVLDKAFKKKCELKTIEINLNSMASVNKLDCLMNQIVDTFNSVKIQKNDDYDLYYGRHALMKLIEALDTSGPECLDNSFLNNHHNAHLLYSCRLILKWCLEDDIRYQDNTYFHDVLQYLNISLEKWQVVKMMIAKNNVKSSPNFLKKLKNKMLDILEIEEKLIESISKLISF